MPKLLWYEDPSVFREKRKRLGVTQHELAKVANVPRSLIADIEAGRRRLTQEVGEPLWDALNRVDLQGRSGVSLGEQIAMAFKDDSPRGKEKLAKMTTDRFRKTFERIRAQFEKSGNVKFTEEIAREIFERLSEVKPFLSEEELRIRVDELEKENEALKKENAELKEKLIGLLPSTGGALQMYAAAYAGLKEALEQKKSQAVRLENATSIDDPVISEIMESYQREIAQLELAKQSVESKKEEN